MNQRRKRKERKKKRIEKQKKETTKKRNKGEKRWNKKIPSSTHNKIKRQKRQKLQNWEKAKDQEKKKKARTQLMLAPSKETAHYDTDSFVCSCNVCTSITFVSNLAVCIYVCTFIIWPAHISENLASRETRDIWLSLEWHDTAPHLHHL